MKCFTAVLAFAAFSAAMAADGSIEVNQDGIDLLDDNSGASLSSLHFKDGSLEASGHLEVAGGLTVVDGAVTLPAMSSAPSDAVAGSIYYHTGDETLKVYDGASWSDVGAGSGTPSFDENAIALIAEKRYCELKGGEWSLSTSPMCTAPISESDEKWLGEYVPGNYTTGNPICGAGAHVCSLVEAEFLIASFGHSAVKPSASAAFYWVAGQSGYMAGAGQPERLNDLFYGAPTLGAAGGDNTCGSDLTALYFSQHHVTFRGCQPKTETLSALCCVDDTFNNRGWTSPVV